MRNKNRSGDIYELLVRYKAGQKDCEVYPNAFKVGNADLVLARNNQTEVIFCDIKADTNRYKDQYYYVDINQIPDHIYMICVNPLTEEVYWHPKREPKGWEDFWK